MEIVNKSNLLASDKYFTARLPRAPRANQRLDFIAFIEDRALFLGRCFHAGALRVPQIFTRGKIYYLVSDVLAPTYGLPRASPREKREGIY